MIKSMTAFARELRTGDFGELTWELRAVNHRYLEPHLRLPEELRALETSVRTRLAARVQRGKLDCNLRYVPAVGLTEVCGSTAPSSSSSWRQDRRSAPLSAAASSPRPSSCCAGPACSKSRTVISTR